MKRYIRLYDPGTDEEYFLFHSASQANGLKEMIPLYSEDEIKTQAHLKVMGASLSRMKLVDLK